MARLTGSAAYLVIALVFAFLIGAFTFTVIQPVWSAMFSGPLGTADTSAGGEIVSYHLGMFQWVWVPGLLAILYTAVVKSRRATP